MNLHDLYVLAIVSPLAACRATGPVLFPKSGPLPRAALHPVVFWRGLRRYLRHRKSSRYYHV